MSVLAANENAGLLLACITHLEVSAVLPHYHQFCELFAQLGLPSDVADVAAFIRDHTPLDPAVRLEDASFWNVAQAALLREEIIGDADWAEVVDQLNLALRTTG